MHIPTHILSGWCVANYFELSPRERFWCMAAASVSDVDGLGILFGEEAYWDYHHVVGHNLLFATVFSILFALFSTHRLKVLLLCLALFHLHFVLDFFGSGPQWEIVYLWPFSRWGAETEHAWELFSWQNITAAALLLVWMLVIAVRQGRSPLEWPLPEMDRKFVAWLRGKMRAAPPGSVEPEV